MKNDIYGYRDYKKFIIDLIDESDGGGRGKRKELADFVGCQVSHITSVLSGNGHLSLEQAEATARFFGLNVDESEHLLNLIQYNRAGTASLKKILEKILIERSHKFSGLKERLKMPDSLKDKEELRYYSSWQYGAVHVLVSIPQFQTRDAIAKKMDLPLSRVDDILSFLVESGLCKKEGQKFLVARSQIHLDKDSPLISKHHTNWRLRSILSLDKTSGNDLHYSSVFTVAQKDFSKVREVLTKSLTEALKIITPSPEEDMAAMTIDLFKI